ncbi:MAG: hypothetical protein EOO77_41320 [Oxalobacteraceae bacterium]|nr:MAG: hypothetical protein EOO77_41320 [Oxalobacteraceae bacterium]
MFRIFSAAAIGSGVGSALLGTWCAIWGVIYVHGHSALVSAVSAFIVTGFLSLMYSCVPVLILVLILGPLLTQLASKNGVVSNSKYFSILAAITIAVGLPFGFPGVVFSILGVGMYGFPAAFAYIRFSSGTESDLTQQVD